MAGGRNSIFAGGLLKAALFAATFAVSSCTTVENAENAKAEVAPFTEPLERSLPEEFDFSGFGLKEFVEFAVTNRPEIMSAILAVDQRINAIEAIESGKPFMPHLTASSRYGQSTANSGPHFSWRNSGRYSGAVNFEMLLMDFGRYDANLKAACEELASAEANLAEKELGVFEDVSTCYFTLLMQDALHEVSLTNEWECIHHLSQATNRFENGEAKLLDVLRARLDLSEAVQARIAASNATVSAAAEFIRSIGVPSDIVSRDRVLPASPNALGEMRRVFETSVENTAETMDFARTNSPALIANRALVRSAMHDVDLAVSDLFPELRLSSSFNFADPSWNWSWAFDAAQSIFLGWKKTAAVDAAVLRMQGALLDAEAAELNLSRDVSVAVAKRDDSAASLEAARTSVKQARENLRVVEEEYRIGESSRIDYANAVADYIAALGRRVKAFYEGQMAEARIGRLSGDEPLYMNAIEREDDE